MENPSVERSEVIEDHLLLAFASPSSLVANHYQHPSTITTSSSALVRKFCASSSTPASLQDLAAATTTTASPSSSSKNIVQFAAVRPPTPTDRIVLIDGPFDSFSVEDLETLRKASEEPRSYVVVAIWSYEVKKVFSPRSTESRYRKLMPIVMVGNTAQDGTRCYLVPQGTRFGSLAMSCTSFFFSSLDLFC
jgi:hypothetical protein